MAWWWAGMNRHKRWVLDSFGDLKNNGKMKKLETDIGCFFNKNSEEGLNGYRILNWLNKLWWFCLRSA